MAEKDRAGAGGEEERRREIEALRESEERYRRIVELSSEMIGIASGGKVAYINPAGVKLLGAARLEDVVGKPVLDFVHPDYHELAMSRIRRMEEEQAVTALDEVKFLRLDGTSVDVEVAAIPAVHLGRPAVLAFVRDIGERKRTQEALRVSNETLEALIQASPLAIVTFDSGGKIGMWNPAAERMFGWTAEEARGKLHPIVPDDKQEEFRTFREIAMRGETFTDVEVRRRRKDGMPIDIGISTAPLRDASGAVKSIMSIITDITERKRTEEALRQSEEQLRHAQKMEAVGRLAGGVAHDFNNLLTAVTGYSDLLLNRFGEGNPMRKELLEIRTAGERAASLTRQLLAFSRRQVLQAKVLDLNGVVSKMGMMLRRLIREDIELVCARGESIGRVIADPGQVEQVIMNLAVNARDAMRGGGRLTIETADVEVDEEGARRYATVEPGSYVMLSVSDTGCGMDAEIKSHLFEPFYTTKEDGTGLGLATVYGIVKQSGGYIWVSSEAGRGTTFRIFLPRVEGKAEAHEPAGAPARQPAGRETILVVEDEEMVRKLVCEILRGQGYYVLEARHGEEALLISERHRGPIHLMLTDVVMPRMSGVKLAGHLSPLRPETKVLYMSGYTDDALLLHGEIGRAAAFIQKPFAPAALAAKVREVLYSAGEETAK